MAKYSCNHGTAVGTSLPIVNLTGSSSVQVRIYEFLVSFSGAPADVATIFKMVRTTDAGTGGTALSEYKVNPYQASATGAGVGGTFSGAPTATDELFRLAVNQRAAYRWIAREGCEFVSTAASANGVELLSVSSGGTPTCDTTIYWEE